MATLTNAAPPSLSWFAPIERAFRTFTTAISFAFFGLGGLFMAIFIFPTFNLFIRDRKKRSEIAQACVHRIWWLFVRVMSFMGTVSWEIDKPEVLKNLRGTIVIANHPSLLDVVFLMSFMQHTRAVVKEGVWRNPFMRGVVTSADFIPNLGDPEKLIADCTQALKDGYNLVIFPEGSRTPEGAARRYQKGFAHIALSAGAPVQVVSIRVNPPMLRKGEPWYYAPPSKGHWTIRVHERIDTAEQYGNDRSPAAVRRLTTDVAQRIEGLLAL